MAKGKLGFGWMRLPQKSENPEDIDFEQVNQMVDAYLDAGFDYFDTSYVYHNGKSENAIQRCLISRYPREKFRLASKLPTFAITKEEQVEEIFAQQLEKCGTEYFDYFLLHNVNGIRYEREIKECHMFEHMQQWKKDGKIRHIGFSYHDSADNLDKILSEHPEVEFVQIALNYIDWNAYLIQAKKCYEVIRKHGCQVIVMEPVKGGMLAKVPEKAEALMKQEAPRMSPASWAIRFAAGLDGILTVLSGMSDLAQVEDNISYMKDFQPLNDRELKILKEVSRIYKEEGPVHTADFSKYEEISPKGVSAAAILEAYNNCMLQPNPGFAAEHNYFSVEKAKHGIKTEENCIPLPAVLSEGTDISDMVKEAEGFLNSNAFFQYEVQ
ncbi:MAG TPA: aldo/keto reductase [Candidatus Blautia pullistercoris]|uniref:Aldo/keto reductase n=1 Tax=Candidatus Blautia pullistercoris TaxID=2838499 RepID=A0A9D1VKD0_9FIRM|nr:aldo/keto reductase [Candidatus Blautia pullistercoris]